MPVKWSSDMDQLLLLKIIETHDFKLDCKKIVSEWPTNKGEVPTPRAISERLVKIRSNAKSAGLASNNASSAKIHSGRSSATSTPKKNNNRGQFPTTPNATSGKRVDTATSTPASAGSQSKRKFSEDDDLVEIKKEVAELSGENDFAQHPKTSTFSNQATPKKAFRSGSVGDSAHPFGSATDGKGSGSAPSPGGHRTNQQMQAEQSEHKQTLISTEADAYIDRTLTEARPRRLTAQGHTYKESDNDSEDTQGSEFDRPVNADEDEAEDAFAV